MFISGYCLTVTSLTIGRTEHWLHYLPLLAGSFVVLSLLATNGIKNLLRKSMSMTTLSKTTKLASRWWKIGERRDENKGFSRIWGTVLSLVLVASWALWGGMAIRDHYQIKALEAELAKYRSSTVVEHHVAIFGELYRGDWSYASDEEPNGGVFRICPSDLANGVDVSGMMKQAVGYVAYVAKWEERGTCKSILRSDLGFWWRNETNNFAYRKTGQ